MRIYKNLSLLVALTLATSCGPKSITRDHFTVREVLSGSEMKLVNGYTVKLIGIEGAAKSKEYLQNQLEGKKVKFVFDNSAPFKRLTAKAKDKSFYAYLVRKGKCLNSVLLKKGYSRIYYTPYLGDSLATYKEYAVLHKNENYDRGEDENEEEQHEEEKGNRDDYEHNKDEDNFNAEKFFSKGPQGELEKLIKACDYLNPITRDFAVKNAGKSQGEFHIEQVLHIYDAIRPPNWHYVNDPKGYNYVSKASNTISRANLSGDCDDFALLMYSLITSIGGDARIVYAWSDDSGHAFCEVKILETDIETLKSKIQRHFSDYSIDQIWYRDEAGDNWLNLDWWAAYPGGKYWKYQKELIFYPAQSIYSGND